MPSGLDGQPIAWEDKTPSAFGQDLEEEDASRQPAAEKQPMASTSGRQAVWEDPDDLTAQVNIASQPRLRKLRKTEQDTVVSGHLHHHTCKQHMLQPTA